MLYLFIQGCGHCKKAKPEFEEAATNINKEGQV